VGGAGGNREDEVETFKAIWITREDGAKTQNPAVLREDVTLDELMEGDVTVAVSHSTVNYKDGLAISGKGPILRRFPMIPGIDLAGTVARSTAPALREGDAVLLNGWGVGETHMGGYAGMARVKSDWLIPRPPSLSAAETMAIGTAGYTAMLAVLALERHGLTPERGPVAVTGASGGVGSVAIALLARRGFEVAAVTGRTGEAGYLKRLGAREVIVRDELAGPPRPLAKERFAGGIDAVGSTTLANLLSMTRYPGAVAACGLAGGADLPATVMPFILRGVALLGVDSVMAPKPLRLEAYERLASDLDRDILAAITTTIGLTEVIGAADDILAGKVRGRLVVDIAR
jgi:acrylyl-CoA reductase (NADPH)